MSSSREQFAIGIDIGATKIASVLLSETGEVIQASQILTLVDEGMEAVLDRVASQILDLTGQSPGALAGVGIGSPGKVDAARGMVYNAVNLGWEKVHLMEEIASRIKQNLPIWVQKDANLSALGEQYFGAARGIADFVYLGIGSGLGAGLISDGRLITGSDWYAADVGHLSIDPDGPECVCGGRGCAETIASGPGLVRVTQQMLANSPTNTLLSNGVALTPTDILAAARQNDGLALKALAEVGRVLGVIMSACTVILNPSRIIVGGGLGLAGYEFIVPAARHELVRRTTPDSRGVLEILPSQVESSAIGAACLVWYERSNEKVNN